MPVIKLKSSTISIFKSVEQWPTVLDLLEFSGKKVFYKQVNPVLVPLVHSVAVSAAGADRTTGGFRRERDGKPGKSS